MIKLIPYSQAYSSELNYSLDEVQKQYTALPHEKIDKLNEQQFAFMIVETTPKQNQYIVGFFILDKGSDKFDYTQNINAVLLRSMSINPKYQGKGFAKEALAENTLKAIIEKYFCDVDEIVLGVHYANIPAQNLYLSSGFVDTKRTYLGLKGKQLIYSQSLKNT